MLRQHLPAGEKSLMQQPLCYQFLVLSVVLRHSNRAVVCNQDGAIPVILLRAPYVCRLDIG